jgi:aldehyde dehydrogenase
MALLIAPGQPGSAVSVLEIQAGRVWTNCYHAYPAHAAFGGYKQSGVGRENHKMMLDHYQQTKNLLVSYSPKKLGFF